MFYKKNDSGWVQAAPGVRRKTLTHGQKTLLAEFRLDKGQAVPEHHHPHEQIGYLISGRLFFDAAGQKFEAGPGDSWCLAGDVPHKVDVLEDSVAVEIFSPVREDYLP